MKHREFEDLLWQHSFQDKEFFKYLEENPIQEILFSVEDEEVQKETGKFTLIENSVLDYIEECCSYDADFITEEREAKLASDMKKVLYYAFFYLKEGVSYMDLVQEGIIGLLKGIDLHSSCLDAWIVREMFIKAQSEIQDLKFGFKNFLKGKRDEAESRREHEEGHQEKHQCSCGHHTEEEHDCCGKHHGEVTQKDHHCSCGQHGNQHSLVEEEVEEWKEELEAAEKGEIDKNQLLEKLLQSDVAIDEMERMIEESLDFRAMKYRLHPVEIEVLNYYFGLLVDRRYSIFEIEEKLQLPKDYAQNIFENAMYKLSTVKGKVEL